MIELIDEWWIKKHAGRYWHELTDAEVKEIESATVEEIQKHFKQPDWCEMPHAISERGCWSLTSPFTRQSICMKYCYRCEYYKKILV